jgi:hypothetical protein
MRAVYRITAYNTVSIDEKPFSPKKYAPTCVWQRRDQTGRIFKPLHKMLQQAPVYVIAAVDVRGLVRVALSDAPIKTETFNVFIHGVLEYIPCDGVERWILIDNASFHALDDATEEELGKKNVGVTHTAPSTCFLDPIEEFFGMVTASFLSLYHTEVMSSDRFVVTREKVKELVRESFRLCGSTSLEGAFARAGLLLTPPRWL